MRRIIGALFAVLIILISPNANAGDYQAAGAGAATCGQFARLYAENTVTTEQTFFAWAQGFMTGLNGASTVLIHSSRDLGATPIANQESFIRNYCDQHPLASYTEAVTALYQTLPLVRDNSK